ncbi:MAG: hypothetical protein IJX99_03980 [Clostridia bacterium]|nr:hypothetical protein [Clostridia bacterium]
MGKSRWNRSVAIPTESLTLEELKEAIHEWAEGCDELEKLLWSCYNNGLKTAGCHVGKYNNYLQYYVASESKEQSARVLNATESYGNSEAFLTFGGNPISGPSWYKTNISISSYIPDDVGSFYASINRELEGETHVEARCFGLMAEFADFFEDKMTGLYFRVTVRNHSEYRFIVESYMNQRNWEYLDELFGSLGLVREEREDVPLVAWSLNASSEEEFYNGVKSLLDAIRSNWAIETPTTFFDDMGFNLKALIMQKKFGTTPEGVALMNNWINTNHPNPNVRKVNY